ncbi:hypothetical protein GC096_15030 [Paenibacillus sp. LMG 31461]|uniref:Uncharacterized protein n=1 Tax=Paenibacillus plantarum TaxID=2654975 RepID=A0ABX1XAZ4_9BACL|nr:hypothetical protein [Paenibacillus plantarum]NOU65346.1 hypothetical protein [Paenibacillus plantarum]
MMLKRSWVDGVLSLLDIEDIEKLKAEYYNGDESKLSFDESQNEAERVAMLAEWLDSIKWKFLKEFKIELYDGTKYKIKFCD